MVTSAGGTGGIAGTAPAALPSWPVERSAGPPHTTGCLLAISAIGPRAHCSRSLPNETSQTQRPATGDPMSSAVTAKTNNGSSCQLVPAKNARPPTIKAAPRDRKRQNEVGTGRMPPHKSRRVAAVITSHADLRDAVQLAATNPDQSKLASTTGHGKRRVRQSVAYPHSISHAS